RDEEIRQESSITVRVVAPVRRDVNGHDVEDARGITRPDRNPRFAFARRDVDAADVDRASRALENEQRLIVVGPLDRHVTSFPSRHLPLAVSVECDEHDLLVRARGDRLSIMREREGATEAAALDLPRRATSIDRNLEETL